MAKAATLDDLLKRKKPLTKTVEICLDGSLAEEWAVVQADYEYAKRQASTFPNPATDQALKDAEVAYKKLRPKVNKITVELTLQAIGRRAYEELIRQNPPTEQQREEAQQTNPGSDVIFNYKTFPKALLAASLVSPKMTEAEVDEFLESDAYNVAELTRVMNAAMEVNQTSKVVDLGKDIE